MAQPRHPWRNDCWVPHSRLYLSQVPVQGKTLRFNVRTISNNKLLFKLGKCIYQIRIQTEMAFRLEEQGFALSADCVFYKKKKIGCCARYGQNFP